MRHRFEDPGHDVRRDPVRHDADNDFVDIEDRPEEARYRAPDHAAERADHECQDPDQNTEAGVSVGVDIQCDQKGACKTHQKLSRRTDVEEAGLVGDGNRNTRHDERRRIEDHVAQVRADVCAGSRRERTSQKNRQTVESVSDRGPLIDDGQNDHDHKADQKACDDAEYRGHHALEAGLLHPFRKEVLFHTSSPFPVSRLAPTM